MIIPIFAEQIIYHNLKCDQGADNQSANFMFVIISVQ